MRRLMSADVVCCYSCVRESVSHFLSGSFLGCCFFFVALCDEWLRDPRAAACNDAQLECLLGSNANGWRFVQTLIIL